MHTIAHIKLFLLSRQNLSRKLGKRRRFTKASRVNEEAELCLPAIFLKLIHLPYDETLKVQETYKKP